MKINKVYIKNLNSLRGEPVEIDFTVPPLSQTGLFAITGDTGAGKSTILDAVTLALYGRMPRNKDVAEVMSFDTGDCYAKVDFEHQEKQYRAEWLLTRAYGKPDGRIQPVRRALWEFNPETGAFDQGLAEKVREVDEQVEAITGLDYDRFRRSVLLAQGDFAAFLDAGEGMRSELLERITGTEIYTRLSVAAHQRRKVEKEKEETLKRQLDQLDLLPPAEVERLQEAFITVEADAASLRESLADLQEKRNLLREVSRLAADLATARKKLEDLNTAWEAAAPDREKLRRHDQSLIYQKDLAILLDARKKIGEQLAALEALNGQLLEKQDALQKHRETLEKQSVEQEEWKQKVAAREPLWEAVMTLDLQIGEKEGPHARLQKRRADLADAVTNGSRELETLRAAEKGLEAEISELEAWMQAHPSLASLEQHLPLLTTQYRDMTTTRSALQKSEGKIGELDKELAEAVRRRQAEWEKKEELSQAVDRLNAQFNELTGTAGTRSGRLQLLASEIQDLTVRSGRAENLQREIAAYEKEVRTQEEAESALEDLHTKDLLLSNQLLSAETERTELDEACRLRRDILEQQQRIASYQRDRALLQPGEECPLCFATEHPFREMDIQPFVDQARLDLEKVEARLGQADKKFKHLLTRHRDISNAIDQYRRQLDDSQQRLLELEERIAARFRDLQADTVFPLRSAAAARFFQGISDQLKAAEQKQAQLRQIDLSVETGEAQLQEQSTAFQQADEKIRELETRRNILLAARDQDSGRLQELEQEWSGQLAALDLTDGAGILQELQEKVETFRERRSRLERGRSDLLLLRQQIGQSQQLQKQLEADLTGAQAELQQSATALEALKQQREQLFGKEDPRTERQAWRARLEKGETRLAAEKQALEAATLELERMRSQEESRRQLLADLERQRDQVHERLTRKIAASPFSSLEALETALLGETEAERLRNILQREERALLQLRSSVQERESELQKRTEAVGRLGVDADTVAAEYDRQSNAFEQVQQQLGGIREKLNRQREREQQAGDLMAAIQDQQAEWRRWERLDVLIGSADGKKFRSYAQGLTLQKLCRLANRHLDQLSGRYIIRKTPGEALDLEIIDTFQADHRRSMNTLSGGERFLVSLALALGLSDLAGRKARIRSLFIDEGFGTLDETALDLAIATLENLQAGGKTIGIISHVKELKERIGVRVQVHKRSDGFSRVEIVG